MRAHRRRQMSAGRKAQHTDALWYNLPLVSLRSDHPHSPLNIRKRHGMLMLAATMPVLQHERGDSHVGEPLADFEPFLVPRQTAIAAAGANHHCRAVAFLFGRCDHGERGLAHASDPSISKAAL